MVNYLSQDNYGEGYNLQYLGGKARVSKRIVSAILKSSENRSRWIEPFVGGSWVLRQAGPHFEELIANDVVPDLEILYTSLVAGWMPPEHLTREEYKDLKKSEPSALRAFAGFGTSFQGKWFAGYAWDKLNGKRTYRDIAISNLLSGVEVYRRTKFSTGDYEDLKTLPGDVVYCDPPYRGTTRYDAAPGFDHERFWEWSGKLAETGRDVFVSEYTVPREAQVEEIWSRTARQTMKTTPDNEERTERLFKVKGRA